MTDASRITILEAGEAQSGAIWARTRAASLRMSVLASARLRSQSTSFQADSGSLVSGLMIVEARGQAWGNKKSEKAERKHLPLS